MSVRILTGDVRAVLPSLPDESVHCVVTSPPYWGLRAYLPANHPNKALEIGNELTLQEWVNTMVEVFREVRRVLRSDGTLWLNLGDAYAGSGRGGNPGRSSTLEGTQSSQDACPRSRDQVSSAQRRNCPTAVGPRVDGGLKPKDMMGQPWRVAFALQADGWWLRQEIIWHKPNPMPESTRDRCTKAHEHVFLLSKSERYFYNFDAMQEPVNGWGHARAAGNKTNKGALAYEAGDEKHRTKAGLVAHSERVKSRNLAVMGWATEGVHEATNWAHNDAQGKYRGNGVGFGHGTDKGDRKRDRVAGVNAKAAAASRDNEGGYADGMSERLGRGAGWRNKQNESFSEAISGEVVDTRNPRSVWIIPTHGFKGAHFATFPPALAERCITAGCPEGGTVLDVFGGSGTVGMAADRQHKNAILIDLDERNRPMATDRIVGDAPLFAEVTT